MLHVHCPAPPLDVVLNLRFQRPAARDEMEGRMRYIDVYLSGSQALISPVDMSMNLWPWHVSVLETNLCLGLIELIDKNSPRNSRDSCPEASPLRYGCCREILRKPL